MKIYELEHVEDDTVSQMNVLLSQLSQNAKPLTKSSLSEIVDDKYNVIFIAALDGNIIGTLTLVMFKIPTGLRARIEDVVVDEEYRRRGIAKALTDSCIEKAEQYSVRTIDLTSSPKRISANQLYLKMGFKKRDTNVYRYSHS